MTTMETELVAEPGQPSLTLTREFEPLTGGSYRYTHHEPADGEYRYFGLFHEVRTHERIVQTFSFDGAPDSVSLEIATFEDLPGRTLLRVTSAFDSVPSRDAMVRSGLESGLRESYPRLDQRLRG